MSSRAAENHSFVIILIVACASIFIVGGIFLASHNDAEIEQPVTTQTAPIDESSADGDTWSAYSNSAGQFSLRYPSSWVRAAEEEPCNENILLLGATKAAAGTCGKGASSQVYVAYFEGDKRKEYDLEGTGEYVNVETSDVTVDGTLGQRYTADYHEQSRNELDEEIIVSTPKVVYVFYQNERTYVATYTTIPNQPHVLTEFDKMVTETLAFKP